MSSLLSALCNPLCFMLNVNFALFYDQRVHFALCTVLFELNYVLCAKYKVFIMWYVICDLWNVILYYIFYALTGSENSHSYEGKCSMILLVNAVACHAVTYHTEDSQLVADTSLVPITKLICWSHTLTISQLSKWGFKMFFWVRNTDFFLNVGHHVKFLKPTTPSFWICIFC